MSLDSHHPAPAPHVRRPIASTLPPPPRSDQRHILYALAGSSLEHKPQPTGGFAPKNRSGVVFRRRYGTGDESMKLPCTHFAARWSRTDETGNCAPRTGLTPPRTQCAAAEARQQRSWPGRRWTPPARARRAPRTLRGQPDGRPCSVQVLGSAFRPRNSKLAQDDQVGGMKAGFRAGIALFGPFNMISYWDIISYKVHMQLIHVWQRPQAHPARDRLSSQTFSLKIDFRQQFFGNAQRNPPSQKRKRRDLWGCEGTVWQ